MAFIRPESHDDVLVVTGFRMEIEGVLLSGVAKIGGWDKSTGQIEWVDGGSGNKEYFTDQIKQHGPLTIVYRVDPTKPDFALLRGIVETSINTGRRYDFSVQKYHHQLPIFKLLVYKALFPKESLSDFDNNTGGVFEVTLEVPIGKYEII